MDNPIMLSPHDIWLLVLAICGGIVTLFKAVEVITTLVEKFKSPSDILEQRVTTIESKISKYEARIDHLESGNEVTQEAILALLSHALNNGDTEGLKSAKKKLEQYLIARGN